ncbi:MAG: alanine racemase [Lachnospiraceae bacterium]|nr:alanine racemase [Lachnospiraceae bacterium]MBR1524865.1 alanine racemase [Lachnospiraceae bacterium]
MKENKRLYLKIDLDAIRFNMESMHRSLKTGTKMLAVIKTDAYGHGAVAVAKEIEDLDYLWGFAVATDEEAVILRHNGIEKPILVLGYTFSESYEDIIANDIRPVVFKEDMARELSEEAVRQGRRVYVHIAVETGMGRIGVNTDKNGVALVKEISELPNLVLEGIFTHFAKADTKDKRPTFMQIEKFNKFVELLHNEGIDFWLKHSSNSAGILEMREANMDMVRAGITLYGLWPSREVIPKIELRPALALKSHIVYIKEVAPGYEVSYGGTWKARRPSRIATIPAGYGDGYPRGLSNRGYVLIRGKRAPIAGRVCMDQVMVDITNIPEACDYDEVTLIGRDGDEEITVENLANMFGGFNYEIVSCFTKRVPRIYYRDGQPVATMNYFSDTSTVDF